MQARLQVRKAMDTMAMLPHAIPHVAVAFSVLMFGADRLVLAAADRDARDHHGRPRSSSPGGTRIFLNAALLQISPDLEAARVAGAPNRTLFAFITLPLVRDSLVFCFLWTALLAAAGQHGAVPGRLNNRVFAVSVWILWQGGLLAAAGGGGGRAGARHERRRHPRPRRRRPRHAPRKRLSAAPRPLATCR